MQQMVRAPTLPVRAHTYPHTHTHTHEKRKNTAHFTFFLGGMVAEAAHWCYPTAATTRSNYGSTGSREGHVDKHALGLGSPPKQVHASEDAPERSESEAPVRA